MKNFGQHNAISCGFHYVSGKFVITMDDDLQNPPEEIPKLIDKINKGHDVVFGALHSKQDTMVKKTGSYFIRFLNTVIFKKPKNLKLSSFRILTREVVDEIKKIKSHAPYLNGMIFSITNNVENVTVRHEKKKYGGSTYSLSKLVKLTFNLIFNYSNLPLQFLSVTGAVVSLFSFSIGVFFVLKKFLVGVSVPGWTSVICLLSFFNGLLMIIMSIIGEYLARIINEISNNQQFVIRKKIISKPDDLTY